MLALELIIVIIVTSFIQSLFGIGILLFGTPLLLIMDYSFIDTLSILLPISLVINLLQTIKGYKNIDYKFYKNIIFFTIPFIVISLFFVGYVSFNIAFLVGVLLIILSLKENLSFIKNSVEKLLSYNKIYFIIMGSVHGLTNLGGSLLSLKVHNEEMKKDAKRATIAISYLTFALFQLLIIFTIENSEKVGMDNFIYVIVGLGVYFITNKLLYQKLEEEHYYNLFKIFLFVSGMMLVLK
jgi:uncharacterized membrane protein YfcA